MAGTLRRVQAPVPQTDSMVGVSKAKPCPGRTEVPYAGSLRMEVVSLQDSTARLSGSQAGGKGEQGVWPPLTGTHFPGEDPWPVKYDS